VFGLQCTKKLLVRVNRRPSADRLEPTTRLGDWCANITRVHDRDAILLVSMRSLLPLLVPVLSVDQLLTALRNGLPKMLSSIGVEESSIKAELREMEDARFTRTTSRQVLGTMTDFAFLAGRHSESRNLLDISLELAETPCSPIDMRSPRVVAKDLLEGLSPSS
jgi:hypothetical protein